MLSLFLFWLAILGVLLVLGLLLLAIKVLVVFVVVKLAFKWFGKDLSNLFNPKKK